MSYRRSRRLSNGCNGDGKIGRRRIGRTYEGTCVILLVHDLQIRVVNAITGELLRDLIVNPNRDYQPTGAPKDPPGMTNSRTQLQVRLSPIS